MFQNNIHFETGNDNCHMMMVINTSDVMLPCYWFRYADNNKKNAKKKKKIKTETRRVRYNGRMEG